jgi:UDP-N-acetyl-D-glucosamine dehydrogenase
LSERILTSILVVGQGYVGTALSKAASAAGHKVFGLDNDLERISELKKIVSYEIFSTFPKGQDFDSVIIAVPTPLNVHRKPDLTYLESACRGLASNLQKSTLIINESTSYPGTLRNLIAPILGANHLYATAPERVDPANETWKIKNTPRLISGLTSEATEQALALYRTFCEVVVEVSTPEVAEAAKLFENTFRQVNIALANEFAQICEVLGISAWEALDAAETKPFGFMRFSPSMGVGGHCIPIDPLYLLNEAKSRGYEAKLISQADRINQENINFVLRRILEEFGSVKGKKVQIAGLSYKPGVNDLRESKATALMLKLREKGAEVIWHDEYVLSWGGEKSAPIQSVDLGIIATPHPNVDYSRWISENTKVVDVSPYKKISGVRKIF